MDVYRKENKAAKAKKLSAADASLSRKVKQSTKKVTGGDDSIKMGLASGMRRNGEESIKIRNNN